MPDTAIGGQNDLVCQFRGQWDKAGLIIDERFNSGGQIPDRFVELLGRKTLNYWAVRDGKDWQWPAVAHDGPMAMLINGWSGSGGDLFPLDFKKAGLGPLIGRRTWGGLIGISGSPASLDGGTVTVPTFGIYSKEGQWVVDGQASFWSSRRKPKGGWRRARNSKSTGSAPHTPPRWSSTMSGCPRMRSRRPGEVRGADRPGQIRFLRGRTGGDEDLRTHPADRRRDGRRRGTGRL